MPMADYSLIIITISYSIIYCSIYPSFGDLKMKQNSNRLFEILKVCVQTHRSRKNMGTNYRLSWCISIDVGSSIHWKEGGHTVAGKEKSNIGGIVNNFKE